MLRAYEISDFRSPVERRPGMAREARDFPIGRADGQRGKIPRHFHELSKKLRRHGAVQIRRKAVFHTMVENFNHALGMAFAPRLYFVFVIPKALRPV